MLIIDDTVNPQKFPFIHFTGVVETTELRGNKEKQTVYGQTIR